MPYEAVEIWDRNLGFTGLRQTREGWEGRKFFRVDTHDPFVALTARPIPAMNAAWSVSLPSLIVVARTPEWYRGSDANVEPPYGGHSIVRIDYREVGRGGLVPPGSPGQAFTEISAELETFTRYYENQAPGPTPLPPLANGEGAPQLVGKTKARVTVDLPLNLNPDLARLIDLADRQVVNNAALTFPKILGTTVVFTVAPGQARYESYSVEATGNALRVQHTLALGRDHKFRHVPEDDDGNASGPELASVIYDQGSLAGLWP